MELKAQNVIIILLGAPGVGKGTLAQSLQAQGVGRQVSTGDLFRREIAANTKIGKEVKKGIATGKLASDEVTLNLVAREILGDVILDGYPRTLKQAEDLDSLLAKQGKKINLVINLYADEETIVDRITNRVICSKCHAIYNKKYAPPKTDGTCDKCGGTLVHRSDDDEAVIKKRMLDYNEKTKPLLDRYKERGMVVNVDSRRENAVEYVKKLVEQSL